jgi:hypothetical protein
MKCSGATLTELSMSVILFFKSNGRQLVVRLLVIKHRQRAAPSLVSVRCVQLDKKATLVP